ncbi:MAG TPA: type II toxin-antitoxin system RelE/ParE family toxin [Tepidisphaeraceae bacterium]|nr:type II toxin-antitoxin system RelE/ParE family toxin [Tepidisphaeraceae bacterium]
MIHSLRISPATIADVDEAAHFIARDNVDAALRFYDSIDLTFRQIREHPQRSPLYALDEIRLASLRRWPVVRFRKHLIFYLIDGDDIQVIRILHGARNIPAILLDELSDQ